MKQEDAGRLMSVLQVDFISNNVNPALVINLLFIEIKQLNPLPHDVPFSLSWVVFNQCDTCQRK